MNNALRTGVCNRELFVINNNPIINEGDLLIDLWCSSSTINSQGYVQLKENIHLNNALTFRSNGGEEESVFFPFYYKNHLY